MCMQQWCNLIYLISFVLCRYKAFVSVRLFVNMCVVSSINYAMRCHTCSPVPSDLFTPPVMDPPLPPPRPLNVGVESLL